MPITLLLWTVLPAALLLVGVCALAIWAVRQPDQMSALIGGLTAADKGEHACATMRPREPKQQDPGAHNEYS